MICVRAKHGCEVRLPAPADAAVGTLAWEGGEAEVPIVNGELVISKALAADVPCPKKILGETLCMLTAGTAKFMVIYICTT